MVKINLYNMILLSLGLIFIIYLLYNILPTKKEIQENFVVSNNHNNSTSKLDKYNTDIWIED